MITFYGYGKCSTCIKAKKLLTAKKIAFKDIDITEAPPKARELKAILNSGDYPLKKLFNTSGLLYRSMNIKEKLPKMSEAEALKLLAGHGKLVKRPIISDGKKYVVGFDEAKIKALA